MVTWRQLQLILYMVPPAACKPTLLHVVLCLAAPTLQ